MKKILLTALTVAALNFAAFAQGTIMPKFGFTSHSMELHRMTKEGDHELSSKGGYVFGLAFGMPLSGNFSFQPEVLYIQKGYGNDEYVNGEHFEKHKKYNQLEVPLLFKYTLSAGIVNIHFNAGPSVGYYLNGEYWQRKVERDGEIKAREGKVYFRERPVSSNINDEYETDDYANRLDIGLQLGGGASLQLGPGAIVLDLRYGHGLSNHYKEQYVPGTNTLAYESTGKTRTVALTVGYAITLGN